MTHAPPSARAPERGGDEAAVTAAEPEIASMGVCRRRCSGCHAGECFQLLQDPFLFKHKGTLPNPPHMALPVLFPCQSLKQLSSAALHKSP